MVEVSLDLVDSVEDGLSVERLGVVEGSSVVEVDGIGSSAVEEGGGTRVMTVVVQGRVQSDAGGIVVGSQEVVPPHVSVIVVTVFGGTDEVGGG